MSGLRITTLSRQMRLNTLHRSISWVGNMTVYKLRDPRIANTRLFSHGRPCAAPFIQAFNKIGFQILSAHVQILAKYCYYRKQHFAIDSNNTNAMMKKPINDVLAENLAYFMGEKKLTQMALSKNSGVAQTTISLYLTPGRRQTGKAGKEPSAKLGEVEQIANALNVDVWELLRSFSSDDERKAYTLLEQAYKHLHGQMSPKEEKSGRRGKTA